MIGIGLMGILELLGALFRKLFGLRLSAEERRRLEEERRRLLIVTVVTVVVGVAGLIGVMRFLDGFY